jgi:hypothetical protein
MTLRGAGVRPRATVRTIKPFYDNQEVADATQILVLEAIQVDLHVRGILQKWF